MAVRWPCCVYGRGVGNNSIQCTSCQKWVHRLCSGIKGSMYKVMKTFICRGCVISVTRNLENLANEGLTSLELSTVKVSPSLARKEVRLHTGSLTQPIDSPILLQAGDSTQTYKTTGITLV